MIDRIKVLLVLFTSVLFLIVYGNVEYHKVINSSYFIFNGLIHCVFLFFIFDGELDDDGIKSALFCAGIYTVLALYFTTISIPVTLGFTTLIIITCAYQMFVQD